MFKKKNRRSIKIEFPQKDFVNIFCDFDSSEDPEVLGTMIYKLCSGELANYIIGSLKFHAEKNNNMEYMQKVIDKISLLYGENSKVPTMKTERNPLIRPKQVIKNFIQNIASN